MPPSTVRSSKHRWSASPWWITPSEDQESRNKITVIIKPTSPASPNSSSIFSENTTCKIAIAILLFVLDDERRAYFATTPLPSPSTSVLNLVNSNGENSDEERRADLQFLQKTILQSQQQQQKPSSTVSSSSSSSSIPSQTDDATTKKNPVTDEMILEFVSDEEANASAHVLRLRATLGERIALVILLVQACLRKGRYSARSRANVRRLAQVLGVPFLPVQDFEKQTAVAAGEEIARRETALTATQSGIKESLIRFAKISGFVVVGGGLMFVTGGLAAPALAGALGAVAGSVATSIGAAATVLGVGGTAVATITGGAAIITTAAAPLLTTAGITAAFGVGGAALAGSRAHNRMKGGGTITLRFVEDQENVDVLALTFDPHDGDDSIVGAAKNADHHHLHHVHQKTEQTKRHSNEDDDDDGDSEDALGATTTLRADQKTKKHQKNVAALSEPPPTAPPVPHHHHQHPSSSLSTAPSSTKQGATAPSPALTTTTTTSATVSSQIATRIVSEVADDNISIRAGPVVPLAYRPEGTRHALESVQTANRSLVISIENLVQIEHVTLETVQCVVETGCPILSAPRRIPPQCCALFAIRNRPYFPTGAACFVVLKVKDNSSSKLTMPNLTSKKSSKAPTVGDALLWLYLAIDLIGGVKANAAWMPITETSPKFPMSAEDLVEQADFLNIQAKSLNSNGIESKTLNSNIQPYLVEVRNEDDKLARIMFKSKAERTTLQHTLQGSAFPQLKTQMTSVVSDLVRHAALDIPTYWTGTHPLTMLCAVSNELTTPAVTSPPPPPPTTTTMTSTTSTTTNAIAPPAIYTRHLRVYDGKLMDKVSPVRELPSNNDSFGAIGVVSNTSKSLPFSSELIQFMIVFAVPVPVRRKSASSSSLSSSSSSSSAVAGVVATSTSSGTNSGIMFVSLELRISDTRTSNKVQSIRFAAQAHILDPLRKDYITSATEESKMTEIPLIIGDEANASGNPAQLLLESPFSASPPIIALQHEHFCVVLEALNPAWFLSSTIGSDANIASQLVKSNENAVKSCALLKVRFVNPDFGRASRRKLSQVIGISGFLPVVDSARGTTDQLLPMLVPALRASSLTRESEVYVAEWEIENQKFFAESLRRLTKSLTAKDFARKIVKKEVKGQVKSHLMTFLASNALFAGVQGISAIGGAFALPAYVVWALEAIDNSYAVLSNRAQDAGRALAETLKSVKEKKKAAKKTLTAASSSTAEANDGSNISVNNKSQHQHEQDKQQQQQQVPPSSNQNDSGTYRNEQDVRPVTLVGVSFGGAVALHCAIALAEANQLSILENVIVAGVPFFFSKTQWRQARKSVVGRLVNIHSNDDPILRLLYRSNLNIGGGQPAGLGKVRNVSGLENVDARAVIRSHLDYAERLPSVLKLIPQREEFVYYERKYKNKKTKQQKKRVDKNNDDDDDVDDDDDDGEGDDDDGDANSAFSSSDDDDEGCGGETVDDDDDALQSESGLPASAVVAVKDAESMITNVIEATVERAVKEDRKLVERRTQRKKDEDEQRKIREKMAAATNQQNAETEADAQQQQQRPLQRPDDPVLTVNVNNDDDDEDDETRTVTFVVANNCSPASNSRLTFSRLTSDIHPSLTPIFKPPSANSSHEVAPGEVTAWSYRFHQAQQTSSLFTMFSALRFEVVATTPSSSSQFQPQNPKQEREQEHHRIIHQAILLVENGVEKVPRRERTPTQLKSKKIPKRSFAHPQVAVGEVPSSSPQSQSSPELARRNLPTLFAVVKPFVFAPSGEDDDEEKKRRKHVLVVVSISDVSDDHAAACIFSRKILPYINSTKHIQELPVNERRGCGVDVDADDDDDEEENMNLEETTSVLKSFLSIFSSANDGKKSDDVGCSSRLSKDSTRRFPITSNEWKVAPVFSVGSLSAGHQARLEHVKQQQMSVTSSSTSPSPFLVCSCDFTFFAARQFSESNTKQLNLISYRLFEGQQDQEQVAEFVYGLPPPSLTAANNDDGAASCSVFVAVNLAALKACTDDAAGMVDQQVTIATFFFQPEDDRDVVTRAELRLVFNTGHGDGEQVAEAKWVYTRIFTGSFDRMMKSTSNNDNTVSKNVDDDDDEQRDEASASPSHHQTPDLLESTMQIQDRADSGKVGIPIAVSNSGFIPVPFELR